MSNLIPKGWQVVAPRLQPGEIIGRKSRNPEAVIVEKTPVVFEGVAAQAVETEPL